MNERCPHCGRYDDHGPSRVFLIAMLFGMGGALGWFWREIAELVGRLV